MKVVLPLPAMPMQIIAVGGRELGTVVEEVEVEAMVCGFEAEAWMFSVWRLHRAVGDRAIELMRISRYDFSSMQEIGEYSTSD